MGLFYVWLKYCVPTRDSCQHLIAFISRDAADEWWRTMSTPPSVFAGQVKRMSPQVYVQIDGNDVWNAFYNSKSPDRRYFSERMLSPCTVNTCVNNPITIIPTIEVTDHISGRWYFVRSKTEPSSYWYLRTSGVCAVCGNSNCETIHVSNNYRTRFCVQVRNVPQVPDDLVMIGKDEISITAPKGYSVYIHAAGDLKATKEYKGETDLLFRDLENRFVTRAERQINGEVWEYVESVERGAGEVWELLK